MQARPDMSLTLYLVDMMFCYVSEEPYYSRQHKTTRQDV